MLQYSFFIGLVVLVTLAFLGLLADFAQPIFWAATFGVVFHPLQVYLERLLHGRRSLAAMLTVIIIFFTVIVPALLIASAVVREATDFYARIQSGEINPQALLTWLQSLLPQMGDFGERIGFDIDEIGKNLAAAAVAGSRFIGSMALTVGQNAARFVVMFFLMLYLLFFFMRDGEHLLEVIVHALPFGDDRERELFRKFAQVSRATVKGTLVIGFIQGVLGGMMFAILGIQGAVFWGVVMLVLSLLPVVGTGLVWGPAALILIANGAWQKGAFLIAFGVLVIGLVDNLLRPILVGRETKMPDYLVLLSTLGGLTVFGVSGFVIGPVIAALFLTVWTMFQQEQQKRVLAPDGD